MATPSKQKTFVSSTRELFDNPSFVILLSTAIVRMSIYQALEGFGNLYIRDVGVSYAELGIIELLYSGILIVSILVGSYISDVMSNRAKFSGIFNCLWGMMCIIYSRITDFWSTLLVYGMAGLAMAFQPAARAYLLLESKENQHLAMGMFSFYRIPLLLMFFVLLNLFENNGFVNSMRIALFWGGIVIFCTGVIRWVFLSDPVDINMLRSSLNLTGVINDNIHTLKQIVKIAPVFALVTCIDAFSDTLYNFLIYFFLNEQAELSTTNILVGRLILDVFFLPLILWGAFKIGTSRGKKVFILLYLIPTLTVLLLLLSLVYPAIPLPSYAPMAFGKIAFLAYAFKYGTDFLWLLILAPLAMTFVPKEHSTKAIGITWLFVNISKLIASPLAGWLYQQQYLSILLLIILVLNFIILGLLMWSPIFPQPYEML